jgi:hypothetical protein
MNNISSTIDGAFAIGGLVMTLAGSVWALMASDSIPIIDIQHAEEPHQPTLKKAA